MRFGRRRASIRQQPDKLVLAVPHVIDISAPPPDEELEERQRLRDAAAQSIGLAPVKDETEEDEQLEEHEEPPKSQPSPSPVPRRRPPSLPPPPPLPPFPASFRTLDRFASLAATLPKYYPPGSLRIFALAKQWKTRYLLLSVPAGPVSHLHLFKGQGPDDRELERLEINADSVVFVAESSPTNPGQPVHVVKVGGTDVGALRRDWNTTDDAGRTVWLLHLPSPTEAQRWITAIKNAIFDQRTQRAGLGPAPPLALEPRGDMDVMLSMRIHSAHASSPTEDDDPRTPPTPTSPTSAYPASIAPSASTRSVRSVATTPSPTHTSPHRASAVAALKGLFAYGARPRSSSAASVGSMTSARSTATSPVSSSSYGSAEEMGLADSFARMGSLLASASASANANGAPPSLHSNSTSAYHPVPAGGPAPAPKATKGSLPLGGTGGSSVLERRILAQAERERVGGQLANGSANGNGALPHANGDAAHANGIAHPYGNGHAPELELAPASSSSKRRTLPAPPASLQPPPRARMKRWTGIGSSVSASTTPTPEDVGASTMYAHPHANGSSGTAGSFGVPAPSVRTSRSTLDGTAHSILEHEVHGGVYGDGASVSTGRSRASSVGGSVNGNANGSVNGTRRGRLSPPASPPPAPPASASAAVSVRSIPHPYAAAGVAPPESPGRDRERASSRASAHSFGSARERDGQSFGSRDGQSFGSASHSPGRASAAGGWPRGKRASGVSVASASGVSAASSSGRAAGSASAHRASIPPPPRPAPTGALPPAPGVDGDGTTGSPNGRSSFRDSRSSSLSVSFRDSPPVASSKSLPAPAPASAPASANGKGGASFRESMSMTHRALRLSLLAPKPPPAGVLPPRPDEQPAPAQTQSQVQAQKHGRRTSSGARALALQPVPGSPATPPPRGPLPPTPSHPSAPASAPAPAGPVRHASLKLKHRLRILSAPPAPHPGPAAPTTVSERRTSADGSVSVGGSGGVPARMTLASFLSASTPTTPTTPAPAPLPASFAAALDTPPPPSTPLGEKIIQFHTQNDPSFLQLSAASTPVLRPLPALPSDPPAPESEYAEIVSLSPPPRRGSRQISVKDVDRVPTPELEAEPAPLPRDQEAEGAGPGPGKLFSLSRHGSVISLGIVTT
ncbi:hypothetical protein FB451DRAFT_1504864 [Mycena latifolia]|nr:hypothetical protein FB451DRAFT_1504864 [Mycena latifolia]